MYVVLKLIIMSFVSFSMLTSCSIINPINIEQKSTITSNENPIVIDVGRGKSGGNISFKVNLLEGFNTKANIHGWDSLYNSIVSYKISLVTTAGTGSNALTTKPTGTGTDVISITKASMTGIKTSPTAQIFITNVPAGTYWVAIAAYDAQNRNVTAVTGNTGTISSVNFAVSTGGGNGDGSVTVAANFSVPASPVTTPLTLIDSFGADIEAVVTITPGINPLTNIALIRFYLVGSKTISNLVDANIIKGPFDITTGNTSYDNLVLGNATTITFKSVPAGTYYVGVAAFNNSTTVNLTTNISNTVNTFANITITTAPLPIGNMGTFSLSNSGGDGGAEPGPGRVVVNSTYNVSSISQVTLPLKLL